MTNPLLRKHNRSLFFHWIISWTLPQGEPPNIAMRMHPALLLFTTFVIERRPSPTPGLTMQMQ